MESIPEGIQPQGSTAGQGPRASSWSRNIVHNVLTKCTDGHTSWERGHNLREMLKGLFEANQVRNHS